MTTSMYISNRVVSIESENGRTVRLEMADESTDLRPVPLAIHKTIENHQRSRSVMYSDEVSEQVTLTGQRTLNKMIEMVDEFERARATDAFNLNQIYGKFIELNLGKPYVAPPVSADPVDHGYTMPPAWYIEAKPTPFKPYVWVKDEHRLEVAILEAEKIKRLFRYYRVRVRAN